MVATSAGTRLCSSGEGSCMVLWIFPALSFTMRSVPARFLLAPSGYAWIDRRCPSDARGIPGWHEKPGSVPASNTNTGKADSFWTFLRFFSFCFFSALAPHTPSARTWFGLTVRVFYGIGRNDRVVIKANDETMMSLMNTILQFWMTLLLHFLESARKTPCPAYENSRRFVISSVFHSRCPQCS